MRRKPMHSGGRQNNNNGGGGQRRNNNGGGGNFNNNRSRKNYPQLREKYLNQAKDALSGGDRVMAEYYFQHADHCYRMMVEDGYRPQSQHNQDNSQDNHASDGDQRDSSLEDNVPNAGALPTFLTMDYTAAAAASNLEQAANAPAQNWEEN
ncbi:MAG: DUF4167 domain-containing protein [Alphaproteobacteria bacterium]|nr:DUF4167 domain-containing protein [Alphaproteobacteria bacterium]